MNPEPPMAQNRALLFLNRLTKTDVAYVASGGFWLGASQIGMGIIALLLSIAFARFVPKDVYGTYRFLLAAFWTVSAFSMSGIGPAMARAVARGAEGAYRQSFKLFLVGCLPMTLIGIGGGVYYFFNHNPLLALGMILIAVLGTFFQPSYLFGSFLEGKRAFKMNSFCGLFVTIIPALALFLTMFLAHNPLIFFSVYLGANVFAGALLSLFVYKFYRPNDRRDPELLNLGFHFSANNVLASLAGQADQLLLYHALGPASVAIYSFATALPDQIKNLANSVATVAFPKFAARPIKEIMPTLPFRLAIFTLALIATTVVYWFFAPLFFHLLFPAYSSSIWYSQLYALALIPVANIIPLALLQAHAAKKELYIMNTVYPIVQLSALFILITFYGLLGAVIALIVSRVFNLLLSVWLTNRYARRISFN